MADETRPDDDRPATGAAPAPEREESLFEAPPLGEQERMVEAILFASAEPVTIAELNARMPHGADAALALPLLQSRYEGRGIRVVRVGDAWAIRTAPDLGFLMRKETVETRKLSRAAIETLAIVAYHQPVTRAEIEEIRGVSVSRGTVDQLLELEWIRFGRRRETPGRPVTYVVTQGFLDHFGLESARDLPGLRDLRAAGLLDNRPPPGSALEEAEDTSQPELFEPPTDPAPAGSTPPDSAPPDSGPPDAAPPESAPVESAPPRSAPPDSTPARSAPPDSTPPGSASAAPAPPDSAPSDSAVPGSVPPEPTSPGSAPAAPSPTGQTPAGAPSADPTPADPTPSDPTPPDPAPPGQHSARPPTAPSGKPTADDP